jgi:hypothetical protein
MSPAVIMPSVLGVQGYLLDEAQFVVVLDGPGEEVGGGVVQPRRQDRVGLGRGGVGWAGGFQALAGALVAVPAGEVLEDVRVEPVEGLGRRPAGRFRPGRGAAATRRQ